MSSDLGWDFTGRTVLITGAARGMGRSHALAFAARGAAIIGLDSLEGPVGAEYGLATEDDARETTRLVEQQSGRIAIYRADVRHQEEIDAAVRSCVDRVGVPDIVVANAGVVGYGRSWEITEAQDVTDAVTLLASDRARYLTGSVLPVDAGYLARP